MRRSLLLIVIIILATYHKSEAQYNYVPNPSFEEYDSIPIAQNDTIIHAYSYVPKNWFLSVPCGFWYYFNVKLNHIDTSGTGSGISPYGVPLNPWSYTLPYDGIAQSAFCPFGVSLIDGIRNYLEVRLKTPLAAGHKYCVSFFITLADSSYVAIDQIGAVFTNDTLQHYNPYGNPPCYLLQTPQIVSPPSVFLNIRNQWQNISGTFVAQGGEQFLTLGNFKTDSNTNYIWLPDESTYYGPGSYYHIDMVSVIVCDTNIKTVYAGADTSICKGDSVMLGTAGSFPGYAYAWSPGTGLSDSCIQNPMASPLHTTTYILTQTYYSTNTSTDTVTVTIDSCNNSVNEFYDTPNLGIKVYPNPTKEVVSIEFTNTEINEDDILFEVYDLMGKKLINEILKPYQKTDVSTIGLSEGIYIYKFVYKNKTIKKDKLVIIK